MTTKTTNIPDWLAAAIDKYHIVPTADVREIFDVFFSENNTVDSPRFRKLCDRLVRLKKVKSAFVGKLEAAGYFDDGEAEEYEEVDEVNVDDEDEFEDVDEDAEFEDDEDSADADYEDEEEEDEEELEDDESDELEDEEEEELEEDDDSDELEEEDEAEAEAEDDSDEEEEADEEDEAEEELEEEDDSEDDTAEAEEEAEEEEEDETPTTSRGGRPRKPKSAYETTGIPSLDEVTAFVGEGYNHTQEFEYPLHLQIAASALSALGFELEYDSRVEGGTIKRPRGGKFVLNIAVNDKRGVKRRGKTAPVFAFVEQITNEFDETVADLVQTLVEKHTDA